MNLFQQFINSPLTEQIGWCLLHSLWQIALIGIVLKLALILVGESARVRYRLAIGGLMTAVLAVVVTFLIVESSFPASPPVAVATTTPVLVNEVSQPVNTQPIYAPLEESATSVSTPTVAVIGSSKNQVNLSDGVGPVAPPETAPEQLRTWIPWLVAVWLVGICLFAVRPIVGLQAAWRVRWSSRSPAPEKTRQLLRQLADRLHLRKSVELSLSKLVQVPTVVGIFRPAILLPFSSLTSLSAAELEAILLHELAHIRRQDHLINLLQTFVETILFYHPAIWWMSSVARDQRELCCDDLAVQSGGNSKSLARALLTLEEKRVATPALAANGGSLLNRVRRLTGKQRASHDRRLVWLGGVAALLVASLCLFVSFSDLAHASDNAINEEGDLVRVELVSLNDFYDWHSVTTTDPRLMHRFWNLFPDELREDQGETIDGWAPDLEVRFTRVGKSGGPPEIVTVKLGVQDGFRWSVGEGVWLMPDQWPLRYSLSEIMQQDTDLVQQAENAQQRELLELFQSVNSNLEEKYQQAVEEYNAILEERDTVTVGNYHGPALTLHQVKVRDLDIELSRIRIELADARAQKQFMLEIRGRGDQAIENWLRNQENPQMTDEAEAANITALRQRITELEMARQQLLERLGANHPDIKATERQLELWREYLENELGDDSEPDERSASEQFEARLQRLEHKIAMLDARYMAINEEFKFHFEKAKQLENINTRLEKKQEEIDLIRDWLTESRAKVAELRTDSANPENAISDLTGRERDVADGMVITVAPGLNMATINLGTDDLIIPGQEFLIFDSQTDSFRAETSKAAIEVSRVLGPHLAEARITRQDLQNPILRSDFVVTSESDSDDLPQDQAGDPRNLQREKLSNNTTYHREREKLAADHAGRWVAIVDGRLLASFDSFEECLAAADEANRHAVHRYIFRPGIDDVDDEFTYSPWITGQPNWWQFGRQFT
ncbi:MAG: M56 family metallopeptidase, partial [Pirellulaceae bacterium]